MRKLLPISISDFKTIVEEGYTFVDKSLLIQDVIDGAGVALITRPRRFGKTMNLSMLRYFYSNEANFEHLFEGLAIATAGERYKKRQGKHPVIFLSFKDVKADNWEDAFEQIRYVIAGCLKHHHPTLSDWKNLSLIDQQDLESILHRKKEQSLYSTFLKKLSGLLYDIHQSKVVILVDEYDSPIYSAYIHGYYDQMIAFMREFLGGGLKDNTALEKGVVTGIMRIGKESIFSGLNNLGDYSILTTRMSEHFGFTEAEVEHILAELGHAASEMNTIRKWYNGYQLGGQNMYNPWSIVQYAEKPEDGFKPYWVNTSANQLLKQLFFEGRANIRADLEDLIRGKSLRKALMPNLVFQELAYDKEAVWTLLLASGYLTTGNIKMEFRRHMADLSIPNQEVLLVYEETIRKWLVEKNGHPELESLLEALVNGNVSQFAHFLKRFAATVFSFHDTKGPEPESFYHAFILGLLVWLEPYYHIRSNRESGMGRFDISLTPRDISRRGIIIEIKSPYLEVDKSLEKALEDAKTQIRVRNYAQEMQEQGVAEVLELAIAVLGKEVMVAEVGND